MVIYEVGKSGGQFNLSKKIREENVMKKQRGFSDFLFCMLILVLVVAMLGSCSESKKLEETVNEVMSPEQSMNTREIEVMKAYALQLEGRKLYPSMVRNDLMNSVLKRTSVPEGFFCDQQDLLTSIEHRVKTFNENVKGLSYKSPSELYYEIYGETPKQSCSIIKATGVLKPETPIGFEQKQEVVQGNKLTPELYDRMIEVAGTCARSKSYMMEATKKKGLLTTEDYDGLMDAVLECKRFELEKALQE